jgi:uncharacterized protein YcbK (DUF882 family)
MSWTRRRLLLVGGATMVTAVARPVAATGIEQSSAPARGAAEPAQSVVAKCVGLFNLHTNERLELEFFRGGNYVADSLSAIQVLLRDYRNGDQHPIDPKLMDYLYDVARSLGVDPVFSVISGYRSPQTNEQLREHSDGVARHSLHLEGRAIDVRLRGVSCLDLATRAREMSRGGVGYYQRSDFVHLDTGAYRTWNG